jgi:sugar-specific transcriptional regulator TrmB
MEESKIISTLKSIGLRRNEALVYLDLIRAGKSSAIDVSKRTKIYRSNTYDILRDLRKKGIVDQSIENEKKFFYPVNPKDLLDYHKQKGEELKEIVPELEKIQNIKKEERRVTISEGLNSVKNIFNSLLETKKPICVYGTPKEAVSLLRGFLDEYHKIRIKKKIPLKIIHGVDLIQRIKELNKLELTEARYLPQSNSNISTRICCNKVVIIIWETPVSAIVIENKSVADAYRHNFEMLWDEAKTIF